MAGHNLGNLLIAAMTDLTGSFETAINEVSKVLAIRGRVVPVSFDNLSLGAELADGSVVLGESAISRSTQGIKRVFRARLLSGDDRSAGSDRGSRGDYSRTGQSLYQHYSQFVDSGNYPGDSTGAGFKVLCVQCDDPGR